MEEKNINQEMGLTTEEVKSAISEVIDEINDNRRKVRMASNGELKRNPYVNLEEKGILTPDNIVKEWDAIQAYKSSLSSNQRKLVQQIVWAALRKAAIKKATECASKNIEAKAQNQV